MLKILAIAAIIAAPIAAHADDPRSICGSFGGFPGCAADYGKGGNDLLIIKGPAGAERIRVQCKGKNYTWQAFGPNTEAFADGIAHAWCGS